MLEESLLVSLFISLEKAQLIHNASFIPVSINAQFTDLQPKMCSN